MAVQRSAGRTRTTKPAAPEGLSRASKAERGAEDSVGVNHEAEDQETLTDRAYRLVEELIVTLELPPETILSAGFGNAASTILSCSPRRSGWKSCATCIAIPFSGV